MTDEHIDAVMELYSKRETVEKNPILQALRILRRMISI